MDVTNDSLVWGHDLCDVFVFSDREYPRLGQMIVDYENPLKKMMEEFVPHGKVTSACYYEIRKSYYCFPSYKEDMV